MAALEHDGLVSHDRSARLPHWVAMDIGPAYLAGRREGFEN